MKTLRKNVNIAFLFLLIISHFSLQAATGLPSNFLEILINQSLTSPTAICDLKDGRLLITEQGGKIWMVKNDAILPTPFAVIPVNSLDERGLLGIAAAPDFSTSQKIYLYYTTPAAPKSTNRIVTVLADGDVMLAGSEQVVINFTEEAAKWHNGGALRFGKDGKLYVATGDQLTSTDAQSLSTLRGKLLRFNPDGTIPTDNPFYTSAAGIYRSIYSYGLRNPFTIAIQPGTGNIFMNDVGSNGTESREEINFAAAGANFGWPTVEGMSPNPLFTKPVYAYSRANGGCSIIGGDFYNPVVNNFPPEYTGKYFFTDFCSGWIKVFNPADSTVSSFGTGLEFPTGLIVDYKGNMWYIARDQQTGVPMANNAKLYKIYYSIDLSPVITVQPTPETALAGDPVTFSVSAVGNSLTYQWYKNNVLINGATDADYTITSSSLSDNGASFKVVVSNSYGSKTSSSVVLTVIQNTAPVASITSPSGTLLYKGGQVINFSGTGTDAEDGTLSASAFTWTIEFHHNVHTHPIIPSLTNVTSGTFTIPDNNETDSDVWYRISLTVTDSKGTSHSVYRDIHPVLADVTFRTLPAGLTITVDGVPHTTPYTVTGVAGMKRSIEAVTQVYAGNNYQFASWSNGAANKLQVLTFPDTDTDYTATFSITTPIDAAAGVSGMTSIHPNPSANEKITVPFSVQSFKLYDINGKYLFEGKNNKDGIELPVLLPGVYQMILFYENGTTYKTERLIIQ